MPGAGKENKNPAPAAADAAAAEPEKKDEKKKGGAAKRAHEEKVDSIGPGDVEKGISAVGWRMPCKCSVLAGKFGAWPPAGRWSFAADPPCHTCRPGADCRRCR